MPLSLSDSMEKTTQSTTSRAPTSSLQSKREPSQSNQRTGGTTTRLAQLATLMNQSPQVQALQQLGATMQGNPAPIPRGNATAQLVTKVKGHGGIKVEVADSEEEAKRLCSEEAARYTLEAWSEDDEEMSERPFSWSNDIPEIARSLILETAQKAKGKDENLGLPAARNLIYSEFSQKQKVEQKKERRFKITEDYEEIAGEIAGDEILEAAAKWMRDDYVAVGSGAINHTLATPYPREEIADAVKSWKALKFTLKDKLTIVSNFHGYEVGPKESNVGDTLDTRGDQGNIIAYWGGAKINIHVNPSD